MDSAIEITSTNPEDLNAVLLLLAEAALPQEGVQEHFQYFLVARWGGKLIGAVGMEHYGPSARNSPQSTTSIERGRGNALERGGVGDATDH